MKYPVIIDSRETEKRKQKAKKMFGEENIIIKQLPAGDYVYRDVGIEFKTVDDYISSVKSRRIYNQAIKLSETFNHHYIIIYGDVGAAINRLYRLKHVFTVPQYLGSLASLSQITPILKVDNETQAFRLTKSLFEKCTDGKNRKVLTPSSKSKNKIVTVLSIVGGMNITRADKLVNELNIKTLQDLINLTEKDITSVHGFGDKTAKNITEWLK